MASWDFVMIFNPAFMGKIMEVKELERIGNKLCHKVSFILQRMLKLIEYYHHNGPETDSHYLLVGKGAKKKHLYLEDSLYRRLKLIHHDLNVFSMAQVVRGAIDYFLRLTSAHGFEGALARIKKMESKIERWKRSVTNRRLRFRDISSKIGHETFYNDQFEPVIIKMFNLLE